MYMRAFLRLRKGGIDLKGVILAPSLPEQKSSLPPALRVALLVRDSEKVLPFSQYQLNRLPVAGCCVQDSDASSAWAT